MIPRLAIFRNYALEKMGIKDVTEDEGFRDLASLVQAGKAHVAPMKKTEKSIDVISDKQEGVSTFSTQSDQVEDKHSIM